MENIKFMYNGIKVNGKLYRAWYSYGNLSNKYPDGTITIYRKDYDALPQIEGLNVQNNTEILTDYFETDRIRVEPSNRWYSLVLEAYNKQESRKSGLVAA